MPRAPGIARAGLVRGGGVHLPCFHYARHGCRQWNAQASVEAQVAVPPPRAFGVNSLPPPCHRLARAMDAKRLCPKALEEWDRATESTRLPSKAGDALVDDDQVSEGSLCGRTQIVTESAATSKSNSKRGPKRKAKNEARMLAFIQQKGAQFEFPTAAEKRAHNVAASAAAVGCASAGSADGKEHLLEIPNVSVRERMESYWVQYAAAFALPNIKPTLLDITQHASRWQKDGKGRLCNKVWDESHAGAEAHLKRAAIAVALDSVLGPPPGGRTIYTGLKADKSRMRCATMPKQQAGVMRGFRIGLGCVSSNQASRRHSARIAQASRKHGQGACKASITQSRTTQALCK